MRYILHTRPGRLILLILIGVVMGFLSIGTTSWAIPAQQTQGPTVPLPPPPPDPDIPPDARSEGTDIPAVSSECPAEYDGTILAEVHDTDTGKVAGDVLTGRVNLDECLVREVATDIKPAVDEIGCTQLALIPISPSQFIPPAPALTDGKPVILAQVLETRLQTCDGEPLNTNQVLPLSFRLFDTEVAAINANPEHVFVLRYVPDLGTWTRIPSYAYINDDLPHAFAHPAGTGIFALALHIPAEE
jgi:hypothetical protein